MEVLPAYKKTSQPTALPDAVKDLVQLCFERHEEEFGDLEDYDFASCVCAEVLEEHPDCAQFKFLIQKELLRLARAR